MKIENLTPEQEKKVQEYYQTYLSYGLSTEPANKELAEKAISEMYRKLGKDIPKFIWKDSPKVCIDYINENQLQDQLRNQLWNRLENQLGNQLGNQLHGQLWNQLSYQLQYQLGYQLSDQLENQLYLQLGNKYINTYLNTYLWGQFDLYWVAFYKFCFNELPVTTDKETLETLNLFDQIGKSCSLWYPYENICVISNRPEEIHLNEKGELHNESGMAIKFRDDFSVYSINGCQISKEIFELYKPSPKNNPIPNKIIFKILINQNYIPFINDNNFPNRKTCPKSFKSILINILKQQY